MNNRLHPEKSGTGRKLVIFSSAEKALEPRLFFKIARSAAAAGYKVVLIAQHPTKEVRDGVRIEPLQPARSRLYRMTCLAGTVFFKALRERADVYHFSDPELLPLAVLLQLLTRRPVVYDLREYHADRIREKFWMPRPLRLPIAWVYQFVETVTIRLLAGLSVVNTDLAGKGRPGRVAVVPNYPPRDIFGGNDPTTVAELRGRYKNRRVVIFLGGISRDRGALVALQAMARVCETVPNAFLAFVGPIHDPAFEAQLRSTVDSLGLADRVDIVGNVPHEVVPSYLAIADVGLTLLQPSTRRHAMAEPIKFFEYAAAGVPQVVSNLPGLRQLVEQIGNGILVDAFDDSQVATAIVRLLKDKNTAQRMSEQGRDAFMKQYNWEIAFERLNHLYQTVMSK